MIINSSNPDDLKDAIERAEWINARTNLTACGHDFWGQLKTMDWGDVIMCNVCHHFFAKIKHLPWLIKGKDYGTFKTEPKTYHQDDVWLVRVPVRITD